MGRSKVGADYGWIAPLAIGAAVLGVGYLLYTKLSGALTSGSGANNTSTTNANTAAAAASAAQAAAQGVTATLTPNNMASIANTVYNLGISASDTTALTQITNQLTLAQNIADLNGIISAFGTKSIPSGNITAWYNTCLSLGINCTSVGLDAFVQAVYAAYDPTGQALVTLNNYFIGNGIPFTF